jgi:plastocyanin
MKETTVLWSSSRRRTALKLLRAPLLAVTLVAVAYAGSSQAAPPPTASVNAGTPQGGEVFSPSEASVAVGGTVTWTNPSDDEHTVSSDSAEPFDQVLPEPPPQSTFQHTFDQPGTFAYHCRRHGTATSGMRGRVVVGEFSRTLSSAYSRGAFRGRIGSDQAACVSGQTVTIFKERSGVDKRIGARASNDNGLYALTKARQPGTYYAKVARTTPSGACLPKKSARLVLP